MALTQEQLNLINQHGQSDVQTPWAWRPDQNWFNSYDNTVNQQSDQFASKFKNLVGRDPTDGELQKFVSNYVVPNTNSLADPNSTYRQNAGSYIDQFIGDNFQGAAKDYATQQLQQQQGQANDLANLFRSQGTKAINDTQQSLLDYQSKLFDKLRPNLITSLQSQGLLNTGGLNQAMAGAQADLANSASGSLMDARLQNEQQANAIAYGGAAAPYQYQQGQIMNSVPYLQNQAQNAMNNNTNTFMNNLNYQHQLGLIGAQTNANMSQQPSFLRTFGQGFAGSLGSSTGNSLGQWFGPNAGGQQGSSGSMAMAAMA